VIATLLTVITAGVLGGAIAAELTALMVVAAVALVLIGAYSGLRMFTDLCALDRDD
jgi:hypothetical protein